MPEPVQPEIAGTPRPAAETAGTPRSAAGRSADHAAMDRLTTELLPALIVKLGATGLGELEVREDSWRVRLRRPADGAAGRERRTSERGERSTWSAGGSASGPGHASGPGSAAPHTPGQGSAPGHDGSGRADGRTVATSPAVGIFQPRPDARAGTKVRAGDRLGSVDVLGIQQEVVAPTDGVVGACLVEPGDAVEYGQDLIVIEFASTPLGA